MAEIRTFSDLKLTTKGLKLLAKAQTGQLLKFTRAVIGDGYLSDGQNVLDLTSLINEIPSHNSEEQATSATVDLTIYQLVGNGIATLRVKVKNGDKAFYFRELGIMALDPDEGEILYAYTNAGDGANGMPPYDGGAYIIRNIDISFIVSNAENVTANVTFPSDITFEDLNAHTENTKIHSAIYTGDTKPQGNNYLWFAPYKASAAVNEVVLQTVPYNGDSAKLHVETNGETKTVSNTETSVSDDAVVVVIK